ncbi:MAG: hypothetical protein AAFR63_10900 [Cyanobacteria bacterium J06631_6]
MSDQQGNKTFEVDGTRPIKSSDMTVADTYQEDGIRPIGESPDFLVKNAQDGTSSSSVSANESNGNETEKLDHKSAANSKGVKVVDTFEADGTRPIMANKYEVVDTIDLDGERPITSTQ